MEPFVVSINSQGQQAYRSFWTGRLGTAILVVPGLLVALVGVILGVLQAEGWLILFAVVIVISGLYASYAGWDHRRKAERGPIHDPLAFAIEADGIVFPKHKSHPWREVRFVLTDENPQRILCSPHGLAYQVDHLDRRPDEIDAALTVASGGRVRLERSAG